MSRLAQMACVSSASTQMGINSRRLSTCFIRTSGATMVSCGRIASSTSGLCFCAHGFILEGRGRSGRCLVLRR